MNEYFVFDRYEREITPAALQDYLAACGFQSTVRRDITLAALLRKILKNATEMSKN